MLNDTEESQQPHPANQDGIGELDAGLVSAALALPIVVAIGLNAIVIANFLADHAQAILTWTGVALIVIGGLLYWSLWATLLDHFRESKAYSFKDAAYDDLMLAWSMALMMSGGIALILRGNLWDAAGAAIVTAGTLSMITSLVVIYVQTLDGQDSKIPSITRMGQLSAIAGAVLASIGIAILSRTHWPRSLAGKWRRPGWGIQRCQQACEG